MKQNNLFSIGTAFLVAFVAMLLPVPSSAQTEPSKANLLRGEYGRYRANNDLLFYDLSVRIDPEKKTIVGTNTIRF